MHARSNPVRRARWLPCKGKVKSHPLTRASPTKRPDTPPYKHLLSLMLTLDTLTPQSPCGAHEHCPWSWWWGTSANYMLNLYSQNKMVMLILLLLLAFPPAQPPATQIMASSFSPAKISSTFAWTCKSLQKHQRILIKQISMPSKITEWLSYRRTTDSLRFYFNIILCGLPLPWKTHPNLHLKYFQFSHFINTKLLPMTCVCTWKESP